MDITLYDKGQSVEKVGKISRRSETVGKFVRELNAARKEDGYRPLRADFVGMKLAHLDQWDLDMFYASCKEAQSFSKHFWRALKP